MGIYLNGGSGTVSGNVFEYCRTAINADDFSAGIVITENHFRTCGTYLAFGGTTPTAGSHTIVGNEFGFNYSLPPASNPTLFNNSNVAPGFRLNVTGNTFGGVASTALTDAQKLSLEARNFHRGRSGRNGVVDFVAGQQIVVAGTTIQSAVDAASAGNEIIVGPGAYSGPVSLNKNDQTVRGIASAGVKPEISIAGAVAALGTVVFSPETSGITLTGFKVIGIDGTAGLEKAAVYLQGNQIGATISGNELVAAGDAALMAEYGASVSGIVIDGNLFSGSTFLLPNTGGPGGGGQFVEPNWPRSLVYFGGASNGANKTGIAFTNNIITAVSGDANNGNTLVSIDGDGVTISGNSIGGGTGTGNTTASLLRARGVNTVITENEFSGSSARAVVVGNGTSNSLIENRFLGNYTTTVVNSGVAPIDTRYNYWGVSNPNFAQAASANVTFSPWYADAAMTILVTAQNFQTITIPAGATETFGDLYIGGGATWTVNGTLRVNGQFVLEPGTTLEVVDGDVVFEDGTVMSGSFTFFNSFGSVNFNDDITISGSAEGLVLVSDVHVADGATITVEGPGSFTIDGCTVDSDGTFSLVVGTGAAFTMARTAFSDGNITISSGDAELYDNRFDATNIDVVAPSNGARIFHNIFSPTTDLDDAGIGTVTTVDAWGNVTSESLTENNLPLGLDISMLPATRTLEAGNAFIQPGDEIGATIAISELQTKIAGVEVLVGYNTDFFASDDLGLGANWDSGALFTEENESTVIGRFNAAFALDFDFPDPQGTNVDQTVADLGLEAVIGAEGTTQVFHRVKFPEDTIEASRLSVGGANPFYLTPFTSNTGAIVVDGTDPLTNDLLTGASIEQDGQDMTQFVTVQGTLEVTASAFDALAGIDPTDLNDTVVTLVGPATYLATRISLTAGPNIGGNDYTTFAFEYEVTPTTLNGDYDVVFTVTDRSGNVTSTILGEITINKNQLTATVELEGLVAGNVTRQVNFVFTQANNAVIETRSRTVTFTDGVGSVTFTDVNGATAFLSAKSATHLRERTAVTFVDGQGSVTYTGAGELQGGDFNGDNIVNLLDYSILRFYWLNQVSLVSAAAAAEITGDGSVNLTDYQIMQSNFYQQGDPQ